MKFGELKSVGHNLADSFASGIGLLVGYYEFSVFTEIRKSPHEFIEIDFLSGETTGCPPSPKLRKAIDLYVGKGLPYLCQRHEIDPQLFSQLTVRYWRKAYNVKGFAVTITAANGKQSIDEFNESGARSRCLDSRGRIRRTPSLNRSEWA